MKEIDAVTAAHVRIDHTKWVDMKLKSQQGSWLDEQAAKHFRESASPTQRKSMRAGVRRSLGPSVAALVKAAVAVRKFRHPGGI